MHNNLRLIFEGVLSALSFNNIETQNDTTRNDIDKQLKQFQHEHDKQMSKLENDINQLKHHQKYDLISL
jgi:septal ring factor EnvC (AmiA/AmiB activator)